MQQFVLSVFVGKINYPKVVKLKCKGVSIISDYRGDWIVIYISTYYGADISCHIRLRFRLRSV